jgi:hypothetical protein
MGFRTMIVFHEPLALVAQGFAERGQAQAQANDLDVQRDLSATSAQQGIRDEKETSRLKIARTRALLSAGGGTVGTIVGLTGAQRRESLIRQHRTQTGSDVRRATLKARKRNVTASGTVSAGLGLVRGVGSAATGGGILTGGANLGNLGRP